MSRHREESMTTAAGSTTRRDERRKARMIAVAAAVAAPLAIWAIVEGAFGTDLRAPATGDAAPADIGPTAVVISAAIASLAGWALLALLERSTPRAPRVWAIAAGIVLLVTLAGPMSGKGVTAANRISLVLLHVAVAAVLIPMLYRTSPSATGTTVA